MKENQAHKLAKKLTSALDAHGNTKMAARFLKGGYGQDGYGVAEGSAINGSFAFEGNQGYYAKDGKKTFLSTVKSMRDFFERRKPVRLIIKPGIGGQHTPFQAIADIFKADKGVKICGEYELGKDYEGFIIKTLKELKAGWNEVAVMPSSKSGSTDETMMVFVDIFYVLLKQQAIKAEIDGEKFAGIVFDTLREMNFIDGKERPGKDLFKTTSLITLIHSRLENRTLQGADEQWPLSIPPKEPRALVRLRSPLPLNHPEQSRGAARGGLHFRKNKRIKYLSRTGKRYIRQGSWQYVF